MRARILLVLLTIALIAAFAAINWSAFAAPTVLSLGFTLIEAPLGMVMLGLMIAVTLAFAIYMALWQGSTLLETRRHAKELQSQRTLAEQAEASRFTGLRAAMQAEFDKVAGQITQVQDTLRSEMRDSSNSLAAMLAEIDDRMKLHASADRDAPH